MKELVELAVNYGMAVVVVAYFLARDWKYNERTIILLESIKQIVEEMKKENDKEM